MQLGRFHVRKRFVAALLAMGMVGASNASAIAEFADALPDLPALPFTEDPEPLVVTDTTWREVGELNRLAAETIEASRTYVGDDGEVITPGRLRTYLERKGSPLAPHAAVFVEAGIANDVDPRLIVSIAGIESSFGKRQRGNNAWGWMGGPGGTLKRWEDWPTAIREYTAALASRYDTDTVDEAFARRYVPPNWRHWLSVVRTLWDEI